MNGLNDDSNVNTESRKTDKSYWDALYSEQDEYSRRNFKNYKHICDKAILDIIKKYYKQGSILEIGAGGSDWLIDLSFELRPASCVGLDYSEIGCTSLAKKAESSNADIDVVHADFFDPPSRLRKSADLVVSFGVVEHFRNLSEALRSKSEYLAPGGVMVTVIPNLAGVYGVLTKCLDRKIYDIHVPHDLPSFIDGHRETGLDILWSGYVGSSNFGVISSCFQERKGISYWFYKQLTRVSKVAWLAESRLGSLPATRMFSPYIVVASRIPT